MNTLLEITVDGVVYRWENRPLAVAVEEALVEGIKAGWSPWEITAVGVNPPDYRIYLIPTKADSFSRWPSPLAQFRAALRARHSERRKP